MTITEVYQSLMFAIPKDLVDMCTIHVNAELGMNRWLGEIKKGFPSPSPVEKKFRYNISVWHFTIDRFSKELCNVSDNMSWENCLDAALKQMEARVGLIKMAVDDFDDQTKQDIYLGLGG